MGDPLHLLAALPPEDPLRRPHASAHASTVHGYWIGVVCFSLFVNVCWWLLMVVDVSWSLILIVNDCDILIHIDTYCMWHSSGQVRDTGSPSKAMEVAACHSLEFDQFCPDPAGLGASHPCGLGYERKCSCPPITTDRVVLQFVLAVSCCLMLFLYVCSPYLLQTDSPEIFISGCSFFVTSAGWQDMFYDMRVPSTTDPSLHGLVASLTSCIIL